MADRVFRRDSIAPIPEKPRKAVPAPKPEPLPSGKPALPAIPETSKEAVPVPESAPPPPVKPGLQPGTYVIQIPKDQILRVPPPGNSKRFKQLSERKRGRSVRRICFCSFLSVLLLFLLAAIAAGVLYLVYRPKLPDYSVLRIAIKGFNLTSWSPFSPEFEVTLRANNPNDKIGFYYEKGSSLRVYYEDVNLGIGALPVFYQRANNVTVIKTAMKGSGLELTSSMRKGFEDGEKKRAVQFKLKVKAPVKIKVGSVKTWTFSFKLTCDILVDKLTAASKMVSKNCDYGLDY